MLPTYSIGFCFDLFTHVAVYSWCPCPLRCRLSSHYLLVSSIMAPLPWGRQVEYALIELIREEPALWDITDANYTKNTLKREFFRKVAATLRELFPHVQDVRLFEICNVILISYVGLTCGQIPQGNCQTFLCCHSFPHICILSGNCRSH